MKRILMAGAMILAFAGGAFANNGSTDNSQDEQRRESTTITEHARHCSKEMSSLSDDTAKQKELKTGNKSGDNKENNKQLM